MLLGSELLSVIDELAPSRLALSWDNPGLLVGDERRPVSRLLCALEMTGAVLEEAVSGKFDTIVTHHPLLFTPLRSLVESRPQERLVRKLVAREMNLVACHTNLDAAAGGIADLVASGLALGEVRPLDQSSAGWVKLVVFVPVSAVNEVAAAVFAAGAGGIGRYSECAFACEGTGWFTPGKGSRPALGEVGRPERAAEVRWETVVPKERLDACLRALVGKHPYEEPAVDIYPVEDVLLGLGIGRVGTLSEATTVKGLARKVRDVFGLSSVAWSGDGERVARRVGVLPGSGRGSLDRAVGLCDVLVTGDLSYHDAEEMAAKGLALIDAPHGELEWWAFRGWCMGLQELLAPRGAEVVLSERWSPAWSRLEASSQGERRVSE